MLPPSVYFPRAVVILEVLLDDQVPGSIGTPAQIVAIPKSVTVERNSARRADTARVVLDYRDFPLDPRMLKDIRVRVHMECLATQAQPLVPTRLNQRFAGLVDEPETVLGPDDETVTISARDFTSIYLDRRWGETPIPLTPGTLQSVVEFIRLQVTPETLPAVFSDPAAAGLQVGPALGASSVYTPEKDATAWDVLTDVCGAFGLVPVWDLDVLRIRSANAPSLGSAFFVYGQNVSRLSFTREFRQPKSKQVKVVAWSPVLGKSLSAVWPLVPEGVSRNTTQGTPTKRVEQVQYNVEGAYTTAQLQQVARRLYEEGSVGQVEGELDTKELKDTFGGTVLGLANGDTLICKLGPELQASIEGMSPGEAVAYLSDPVRPNALNPSAAGALVTAWSVAQQAAVQFYVLEAMHEWDRDTGYRLRLKFANFLLGV